MKNWVILLIGLVVVLLLLKRVSGFDQTAFTPNMTAEEAEKLYQDASLKIQVELGRRMVDVQNDPVLSKKLESETLDATTKLNDAYQFFLANKHR
jgi:hypothetical protein